VGPFFALSKLVSPNPTVRIVALVGNPNSGKTTIFNALTGERRDTGNRPGVTVECVEGRALARRAPAPRVAAASALPARGLGREPRDEIIVVDLPAAYDFDGHSEDQAVARDYLLSGRAGAVLNVVDAMNLERNLYLTIRLLEAGLPLVVALNRIDQVRALGLSPDSEALSLGLGGVPVVQTVALTGEGLEEALAAAAGLADGQAGPAFRVDYGPELEAALASEAAADPGARRQAVRRLEAEGPLPAMAAKRFELAARLARGCLGPARSTVPGRRRATDLVDRVVTHRYGGVAILLAVMWAVFKFTFSVGTPLVTLVSRLLSVAGRLVESLAETAGAPDLVRSFVVDGLMAGMGSVLVFLPLVFALFLALAVLEETGYMARASCVSDRFMRALGLGGKAFIPLVLGFGCNVPAILAARTLENRRDRLATILVSPFMSCSGRLPVYTLFAGAFFGARQGLVVFSVYLLGVVMAAAMAKLVTARVMPGESADFLMELPSYRWPSWRGVLRQAWGQAWMFIRKAGTIIAAGVVVMWVLGSLPWGVAYASRDSLLGRLGAAVAVVLRPAGLGNWETGAALVFGLVAKEFVVAALGLVHGAGEQALPALLAAHFTPLTALSFMVLVLLYSPCLATVAAIRKETGSWKWPALAAGYSLVLGLGMATAVYQLGRVLGMAG